LPRQNWSRPLPRPLTIPTVRDLTTLADVRELIRHVPKKRRDNLHWRHVAAELTAAAQGADPTSLSVALQMVLSVEGVECRAI
jgi:hypothetical protein